VPKSKSPRNPQIPLKDLVSDCVGEYNTVVKNNPKYQILGGKRSMVLLLCAFPKEFLDVLEKHYGKYKHTEAALGLHNLNDESWRPGTIREKSSATKSIWHDILVPDERTVMTWAIRSINDFEAAAPPKSSTKKKRDSQPSMTTLNELMDRACLYEWMMSESEKTIKLRGVLQGVKLDKYRSMWAKGRAQGTNAHANGYGYLCVCVCV
jgi:hypothetical protein